MSGPVASAALVCTVLGLVCAAAVLAGTRSPAQSLPVLLDFLLAAGLLRLSHDASWPMLATAALVIALRRLVVSYGLGPRRGHAAQVRPGQR